MYKWIKEKEYNPNAIQISPKLRSGIESFLNQKDLSWQELYRRASYFLNKWEFDDYQIGQELLRKIEKRGYVKKLLDIFKQDFADKILKEEYELVKVRPNSISKIDRIQKELSEAIENDNIPWYIEKYELPPYGSINIAWANIDLHEWTMVPKLTTLEIVNQVNDFIESHKDTNYQIIDIWTGETNFIPQVIRQNDISHNVWWFDVEMMFDNEWNRIIGNFSDWNKIKPYIQWDNLILTANLPYSPEEDIKTFHPSVQRESESTWYRSFKWWSDWLDIYRKYIDDISDDEENVSKIKLLIFEALEKNIWRLEQYVKEKFPQSKTSLHKHYNDKDRILRVDL